jgi:hypothetical protein
MPFPINIITGWLVNAGMKEVKAGPVAWVIAGLIVLGAVLGAIKAYDAAVIDRHETERDLKRAKTVIERSEEAQGVDTELERRDDEFVGQLEEGARNAASNDPEGAARPVGPVSSDVHERLREQRERQSGSAGD